MFTVTAICFALVRRSKPTKSDAAVRSLMGGLKRLRPVYLASGGLGTVMLLWLD